MKKMIAAAVVTAVACADAAVSVSTNDVGKVSVTVSDPAVKETLETPFLSPDVASVEFVLGSVVYDPPRASTYEGGTDILSSRVYIRSAQALGTGPIRVGGVPCANSDLIVDGCHLVLGNKIVFGPHRCRVMSNPVANIPTTASVTLKSIGVEGDIVVKTVPIGRDYGGTSIAVLSLTDPDSGAVGGFVLRGDLALTLDGGVVKANEQVQPLFFDRSDTACVRDIAVTTDGFGFDVPAGVQTALTSEFAFDTRYTVEETCLPPNAGFEDGKFTGWSVTPVGVTQDSTVQKNGASPFDGNGTWPTPEGDYFAVIRHDTKLEPADGVTLPTDGWWRVRFLRGCRPDNETGYSLGVTTTVTIDGETVLVLPALQNNAETHGFREYVTRPVRLPAGTHTLAIENGSGGNTTSFNFDGIRFERVSEDWRAGTVVKTGSGRLSLVGWKQDRLPLDVGGGTLSLCGCALTNAAVTVAAGAELDLAFSPFAGKSGIDVDAGAVLRISDAGGSFVLNGSFEYNGERKWSDSELPGCWTLTDELGIKGSGTHCYLQHKDGPTLGTHFDKTAYGNISQTLREGVSIKQDFVCPEAGVYVVSFMQTCRRGDYGSGSCRIPTSVVIDGETVMTTPRYDDVYDYTRFSVEVPLSAGSHSLKLFAGAADRDQKAGNMVLVDDVRVCRKVAWADAGDVTVRLSSGSTLRLDNSQPFVFGDLSVDGVRVAGGRNALSAAGITVSGAGKIKVGRGSGFQLIIE